MDNDEDFLAAIEADNAATPAKAKIDERREKLTDAVNERQSETEAPTTETPPTEAPERARGPDGKFLPKEKAPEPPAEAAQPAPAVEAQPEQAAQTPPPPEPPQHAPLAALLDERDKRKAAEDQLRQLQAAQAQAQPVQIPDMLDDPDGYNAYLRNTLEAQLFVERRNFSERIARMEHGADVLAQAKEWGIAQCDKDTLFNEKVRQSEDPYGLIVNEWKRSQIADIPMDELEQFRAWKTANGQLQAQQQPQPPPGTQTTTATAIPPKSLASAPSAGGVLADVVKSEQDIFETVIPKG